MRWTSNTRDSMINTLGIGLINYSFPYNQVQVRDKNNTVASAARTDASAFDEQ